MKKGKRVFAIALIAVFFVMLYGNVQVKGASSLMVVSSFPSTYSSMINVNSDITVVFNRNVKNGAGFSNISLRDSNNQSVQVTCKIDGMTLRISPNEALAYGSYYIVTIPYNAVADETGIYLHQDFILSFVTVGDYIPPRIESTEPKNNTKDVDINSTINIKFTEKIKAGNYIEEIRLYHGNKLEVPVYIGINGNTLTIKPLEKLQYNTSYFVYLPYNSVVDFAGNPNGYAYPIIFTTKHGDDELKVSISSPSNNAKYVSINKPIAIFYNETIVGDKGLEGIKVSDNSGNIPIIPSISGNVLFIRPKNSLNFAYNTTYNVTVPAGAIKGISGASAKNSYTFSFTTEGQMQSPKVTDASPQNGVTDAAVNSTIKVTFSENIKQGEAIFDISLKDEKGNEIKTDLSIDNNVLNIRPKTALEYNTSYTYTIPYGSVVNYSNSPLKQDYEFKFKTDIERFNPYVIKSYPVNGALNTTVDGGITLIFSEEIKKSENFDYITLRDVYYNELPVVKEIFDKTLKITPVNNLNLAYNTGYTVTIPYGAVKDVWDNQFVNSNIISFTTGFERFSPIIKMVKPEHNSSDIKTDSAIEVIYNDKMLKGDNFDEIVLKDSQGSNIKFTADIKDDMIIIKPIDKLEYNTSYSLVIPVGGFKDYWNGVSKNDFTLDFKTEKEKIPPVVKGTAPVNGSKNVNLDSSFTIEFNENVISGKLFKKISLTNGNMKNIPYTAEIKDNKLTIKPVKPLEELTAYTLRIPFDAVTDKSENVLKEDVLLNFTTKPGETSRNALTVNDVKFNSGSNVITVAFNRDVTYGSNIKRVLLRDQNGKTVLLGFGVKANTLIITPRTKLTSGSRYTLLIPAAGVRDKQGKNMINQYGYSFIVK